MAAPRDDLQAESILSPELEAELRGNSYSEVRVGENDEVLVLGPRKKKTKKAQSKHDLEELKKIAETLSKSKLKKLQLIEEKKSKAAQRGQLFASLRAHELSEDKQKLLFSSKSLGHKETLRERLRRKLAEQRMGISTVSGQGNKRKRRQSNEESNEAVSGSEYDELVVSRNAGKDEVEHSNKNEEKHELEKSLSPSMSQSFMFSSDDTPVPGSTLFVSSEITPARSAVIETQVSNKKRKRKVKKTSDTLPSDEQTALASVNAPIHIAANPVQTPIAQNLGMTEPSPDTKTNSPTASNARGINAEADNAMQKLLELRKKNEEKRKLKANQSQSAESIGEMSGSSKGENLGEIENFLAKEEQKIYVPSPIVLKGYLANLPGGDTADLNHPPIAGKKYVEKVDRLPEIALARMELPVCRSEQEVMEAIEENDCIVICGETGSGKTTQVPQFLYEAGYGAPEGGHPGIVGVTQPRRVATISTAERVATELNVPFGGKNGRVGYQIRYDTYNVGSQTRIKFMTDGILLKEIQTDFLLAKYSVIILDEAHERNLNTDVLIGLLSRVVKLRRKLTHKAGEADDKSAMQKDGNLVLPRCHPLKLVIMSATLRVEDFTENPLLFPSSPPPVLRIDSRQYPVTIHFNKKTELDDYVGAAFRKVCRIHKTLPEGGILVFLTGQSEIVDVCRRLRKKLSVQKGASPAITPVRNRLQNVEANFNDGFEEDTEGDYVIREHDDIEEEADLQEAKDIDEDSDSDQGDESSNSDEEEESSLKAIILPLYSLLSSEEQRKIFITPPDGHRLIVVATNVAETSITIPGIRYVVDAGRAKDRVYDLSSGVSQFKVNWISKASADQRAGRAGRTGPGHCYRLYSSAFYANHFKQFAEPEITSMPIEDVVLQMKAMGIDEILKFPFPTPPNKDGLLSALTTLKHLGAIDSADQITEIGRSLCRFPVSARYAKMLLLGQRQQQQQSDCLSYVIALVAALSQQSPLLRPSPSTNGNTADSVNEEEDIGAGDSGGENGNPRSSEGGAQTEKQQVDQEAETKRWQTYIQWKHRQSDSLAILRAAGAYAYAGASEKFCVENALHTKTMEQMLQLRVQLTSIMNSLFAKRSWYTPLSLSMKMLPPSPEQEATLRQIIAAGLLENIARRAPPGAVTTGSRLQRTCGYISCNPAVKDVLYIHPHSFLFSTESKTLPEYLVYQSIVQTSLPYMKGITAVKAEWIAQFGIGSTLYSVSEPLDMPPPMYDKKADQVCCFVTPRFGAHDWELPCVRIPYPIPAPGFAAKSATDFYRWFLRFLLEGKIVSALSALSPLLRDSPAAICRRKYDRKLLEIYLKLRLSKVDNKKSLLVCWAHDREFLKEELRMLVKQSTSKAEFDHLWKGIVGSVL